MHRSRFATSRPSCAARRRAVSLAALVTAAAIAGCAGPQSTLDPAGRAAESIASLFWWMVAGAAVTWLLVVGLVVYYQVIRPGEHDVRRTRFLIIGGGALLPTILLGVLLVYGLAILPALVAPAPEGSLRIVVSGVQYWWRVRYEPPNGPAVDLANEIRLPVDVPVEFELQSEDVIHSFWIPSLGGKIDAFPGRRTRLALEPTRTGVLRGVCAEFCGTSHAFMSFYVEVMERDAFDAWLARQAAPAAVPADPLAARGATLFLSNGCGSCHTVRGTPADGAVGPDLTHVGARMSLGAGLLANDADAFVRWIENPAAVKPGVHMPAYDMLPDDDLRALASYLDQLQ